LVIAAILIAVASLVVSHILTRDLEIEERNKVEVWAEAMRSLSTADENTDLNLVLKVINENHTIPVIVMDSNQRIQTFRNINIRHKDQNEILMLGKQLLRQGRYIRIQLGDTVKSDYIDVCYDDSVMLKRLEFYPFVQLKRLLIN
jgi:two-component system, sporulation sensor kinase D